MVITDGCLKTYLNLNHSSIEKHVKHINTEHNCNKYSFKYMDRNSKQRVYFPHIIGDPDIEHSFSIGQFISSFRLTDTNIIFRFCFHKQIKKIHIPFFLF